MSMNLQLRSISSRALERLREHPHLAASVLTIGVADLPGAVGLPVPPDLSAVLRDLPEDLAEQLRSRFGDSFSQSLGSESRRAASADAEWTSLGVAPSDFGPFASIDKAWHGLHFLLTGSPWATSPGLGSAILGGDEIGDDLGYGPVRAHDVEATAEIAEALDLLTADALRSRYLPDQMEAQEIYPGGWDDEENLEWLLEAFETTKNHFRSAREARCGMLILMS